MGRCLWGGASGEAPVGTVLPPPSGPTLVGITPRLAYRVHLSPDDVAIVRLSA